MIAILSSVVNIILERGGGEFIQYDHLMCTRIFPLYYEQDNCRSSKNHEESGMASICIY